MFWNEWEKGENSVNRDDIDGGNIKRMIKKNIVEWKNGVNIDNLEERI
jgi:hypothetical protein